MKRTSPLCRAVGILLIPTLLGALLGGCGGELPDVGEIQVQPDEIAVGEEATLTVEASGSGLTFQWSADRGELTATSNSSTYQAPPTPGRATVTVQVSGDGGSVVKSRVFEIIDKPAAPPPSTPVAGAVTLASPQEGQIVQCMSVATGSLVPKVTDPVWPVVYIDGRYHPQDEGGKAPPKGKDRWVGTVRFGNCDKPEEASGRPFQLLVVTADKAANQEFESYIQQGRKTGYPGMPALPSGVTEHARILVKRD